MGSTLSVRLNKKAEKALDNLVEKTGKSKSELLREGLVLTEFFEEEKSQGKKVFVVDKANEEEKKEVIWA
jgi:Arc/MetJ-type ribon-helix-helix transcriptional regulator